MKERKGKGAASQSSQRARLRHFSKSLPVTLLRARESVMQHFRETLRESDMTEQQWRILRALMSVDQIEVTELAHATFLLGPSLSRILKDLEARGLVERMRDENDLRRGLISITSAGQSLIEASSRQTEEIYNRLAEAYGRHNLDQLLFSLEELERVMNAIDLSEKQEEIS